MLDGIGTIVGAILILLGLVGSVLPGLPGPPLGCIGLFLLALAHDFSPPLTSTLLMIMVMMTIAATAVDYFIPWLGAKRYGASKWGIAGSIGGVIIGTFFSPLGMLLGAFIGAVFVEWMVSRKKKQAFRAGWGVLVGSLFGMVLKLGISGVMAYYFVRALLS